MNNLSMEAESTLYIIDDIAKTEVVDQNEFRWESPSNIQKKMIDKYGKDFMISKLEKIYKEDIKIAESEQYKKTRYTVKFNTMSDILLKFGMIIDPLIIRFLKFDYLYYTHGKFLNGALYLKISLDKKSEILSDYNKIKDAKNLYLSLSTRYQNHLFFDFELENELEERSDTFSFGPGTLMNIWFKGDIISDIEISDTGYNIEEMIEDYYADWE